MVAVPVNNLASMRPPSTPRTLSRVGLMSRPAAHASDIEFDRIPSPKPRWQSKANYGPGPSKLSKSISRRDIEPESDLPDEDGGYDDGGQDNVDMDVDDENGGFDHQIPQEVYPSRRPPKQTSFLEMDQDDDEEEEEDESPEETPTKSEHGQGKGGAVVDEEQEEQEEEEQEENEDSYVRSTSRPLALASDFFDRILSSKLRSQPKTNFGPGPSKLSKSRDGELESDSTEETPMKNRHDKAKGRAVEEEGEDIGNGLEDVDQEHHSDDEEEKEPEVRRKGKKLKLPKETKPNPRTETRSRGKKENKRQFFYSQHSTC